LGAPESGNVTPSDLCLTLDWRNVPGESPDEIVAKLEALLEDSLMAGCRGRVELVLKDLVTYTGFEMEYVDIFPSFTTSQEHPWLAEARAGLEAALGRVVDVGIWPFATDGGHFAAAGATVLGFGPGDDSVVHTVEERLPTDQMVESVVGYIALGLL
jgi:acetylornithine deacetylase/succinyl-diaminopimelate desuccinylase-like protein